MIKTFAVVKANAYGHGAVEVSKYIESIVDGFCVSNLDEAIELRQAGIVKMILVLGVVMPEQVILAKNENITLTVASLEWLRLCQTSAVDLSGLEVHIKVDSGMGRIGVRQLDEGNKLISELGKVVPLSRGFSPILQQLMKPITVNSINNLLF